MCHVCVCVQNNTNIVYNEKDIESCMHARMCIKQRDKGREMILTSRREHCGIENQETEKKQKILWGSGGG